MVRFLERLNTPKAVAVALVLFLAVDGFLFYRYHRFAENTDDTQPISRVDLVATEETTTSPSEQESTISEEATTSTAEEADVLRVVVRVVDAPSWLNVRVDGQTVLEQVGAPGFSQEFEAEREIRVWTGNAGATQVEVNGQDLGFLGSSGEVTTHAYTR